MSNGQDENGYYHKDLPPTRHFNLQGLDGAIPTRAYFWDALCGQSNLTKAHYTITYNSFFPQVALSSKVNDLHPSFSDCWSFVGDKEPDIFDWQEHAVHDPPISFISQRESRTQICLPPRSERNHVQRDSVTGQVSFKQH